MVSTDHNNRGYSVICYGFLKSMLEIGTEKYKQYFIRFVSKIDKINTPNVCQGLKRQQRYT
ncbi:hypothetical protein HUJ05_009206 [Dendroctonus ponderosae]|nr:hypothetical protein HUJ05_009206 [Dendroctonus ponderosae]